MQIQRFATLLHAAALWAGMAVCGNALSETAVRALPVPSTAVGASESPKSPTEINASWKTEKQARALTVSIPGPRGQIVDRNGVPLAQNKVIQHLALQFPYLGDNATDAQILAFAKQRIIQADRAVGQRWMLPDAHLLQHYKNRRWLPLVFSITDGINGALTTEQLDQLAPLLHPGSGLLLQAAYMRHYPKGAFAPHIIGYTGKTRPLPVGPVDDGQPLFEETEGRSGLEKTFDKDLQGRPGLQSILFNPDGTRLKEETIRRPAPGHNVITTLDYDLQKYAENALARHTKGGAMVIVDVRSGDILAMASYPLYDLNLFIPGITADAFDRLNNDPAEPLIPRAFAGTYPPASTFKVVVATAALESGKITPHTAFDGSPSIQIGDRVFHNWNVNSEGYINVVTALKRSCNTWFYQAGMAIGAKTILDMAARLGFGERTGIQLEGESPGFLPSDASTMQTLGHKMLGGDIANLSIGQGATLVTPLQAAQAMATVADGVNMPQLRIVKQVQNSNDQVLQEFAPAARKQVNLNADARATVVKGMVAVVNGDNGTGHAAALDNVQLAGKTGTAQWKVNGKTKEERHLAWFTGFLPANDPIYAYAVVYEGQWGEVVSGGAKAAPIVHEVFENFFKNAPPDEPVQVLAQSKDAPKAIPLNDEDERTEGGGGPGKGSQDDDQPARPAAAQPARPQPNPNNNGLSGFFRRLFGR